MRSDYQKMFAELAQEQMANGLAPVCPRCGKEAIRLMDAAANAVSRYEDVTICHFCGDDETMREHEKKGPLPAYQWHFIRSDLHGHTFHDLLERRKDLDCALIIGNSDMPADFVWHEGNKMTVAGREYYAEIMQAPYRELPNGNIEIFCDNYELGKDFCLSAAGYTGTDRYNRYFCDEEPSGADMPDTDGTAYCRRGNSSSGMVVSKGE